jgi:hypothetical protein
MQLPLLPLNPIGARPDLQGTQPIAVLSPEDRAKRITKRRRDIALVMQNEPYRWYASHVVKRSDAIPIPEIEVDTVGVRAWLAVMRRWKFELYEFRARHSSGDAFVPDLDSDKHSEMGDVVDAMERLGVLRTPPPTPPMRPSPSPSWAAVAGGGGGGNANK